MINEKALMEVMEFEENLTEIRVLTNCALEDSRKIVEEIGEKNIGCFKRLIKAGYSTETSIKAIKIAKEHDVSLETLERFMVKK